MANTNAEIIALLQTDPSQAIRGVLDTLYLYNPATVNDLIEKLNEVIVQGGFEAIVVDTLPETGVKGTIYFVPSGGETPNVYNEYVWVTETEKFEMVGSAQVDLSNYYTKDEIDDQLIDIVGYIGDETRPLRNDLNQLNKNTIKVADWVNAKDEEGNRAVLETEAQDAYRAINELNAKIGSGGGASLPDQTGNAGKFLKTDGTTVSWGKAVENSSEYGIGIGGGTADTAGFACGYDSNAGSFAFAAPYGAKAVFSSVALGFETSASAAYSIAVGYKAKAGEHSVAVGESCEMMGHHNIGLGFSGGKITENYVFYAGRFKMLDLSDGTIPTDRYTTTPTTAGTYVPKLTIAEDGTTTREWGTESGGGTSLPDQTGNAGKFLTTDGTTASWGEALANKSSHAKAFAIGYPKQISTWTGDIFIGTPGSSTTGKSVGGVTVIGDNADVLNSSCFNSIALGSGAWVGGHRAIQIGRGTNNDANTLKVANNNGNYEMMSVDGTIPTDRYTTTPTDAGTYIPKLTIAEDGTATREWGTESGGAGGDYLLKTDAAATYLPLSGGSIQYLTLTNNANYIGFKLSGSYKVSMRPLNPEMLTTTAGLGLSATILSFGWDDWSARFRLFLDTGTQKLFPNADNSFSLGLSERRWVNIYTYKLNNGADLIVPTEGGTLARIEDINAAVGDISTALTAILGE